MLHNASSQLLWQATLWIGFGTLGITGLLLIALFGLKLSKQRKTMREEKFLSLWQPGLMACALEDTPPKSLPNLRDDEAWLLIKLFVKLQTTLKGDPNQRLKRLGQQLGCANMARKMLKSKHRSEKVFGLITIAYMQEAEDWNLLMPYLNQSSNTLTLYASLGLLKIDASKAAPLVVTQLLKRPDVDLLTASSILKPFRKELHEALATHIIEVSQHASSLQNLSSTDIRVIEITWLLKVAHALDMHISTGILLPFFHAQQPINLITGAMRLIKVPDALNALRKLALHSEWQIRNQVCLTLAKMGDASDIPLLTQLMLDPQWWVRYRAAQALIGSPFITREALKRLIADLPDRYARDMAQQVFAESFSES